MIIQQANATKLIKKQARQLQKATISDNSENSDSESDTNNIHKGRPWRSLGSRKNKYHLIGAQLKKYQSKRHKALIQEILTELITDGGSATA